ncbi:hypothetical protein RB25_14835 [Herbaspirillum rubrisubalbicans]|nr:hypothetical protein RB25_14835 [Herbaspirillum rubrisubalbicans]
MVYLPSGRNVNRYPSRSIFFKRLTYLFKMSHSGVPFAAEILPRLVDFAAFSHKCWTFPDRRFTQVFSRAPYIASPQPNFLHFIDEHLTERNGHCKITKFFEEVLQLKVHSVGL